MEIAGYHLLEPLAQCGASIDYLARHEKTAKRRYVIKQLKKEFIADQEFAGSFLVQAKLAQQLRHPGFVKVYESGRHEGSPFCVMEHIPGASLEEKLSSMCLLDKIYVVKRVARSLEYIASFERVHGNINPANILIHEQDSRVVLVDCGFTQDTAYRITYPQSDYSRMTGSYLSPEQLNFSGSDPRSDVYSLGAVFHTLLAGKPLGDGPTVATPELPEAKQIFQPLIAKAMAKYPEDRFQSVRELVKALEQFSDEDILQADGVNVAAAQPVANVVPFKAKPDPKSKPKPAAELRKAGGELAKLLQDNKATQVSKPANPSPRVIVRPKGSMKGTGNARRKGSSIVTKPGAVPLAHSGLTQRTLSRRPGIAARLSKGIVVGFLLILIAGFGLYGARNNEQVARDFVAHPFPAAVKAWFDNAGDMISARVGAVLDDIQAFSGFADAEPDDGTNLVTSSGRSDKGIGNTGVERNDAGHDLQKTADLTAGQRRRIEELLGLAGEQVDLGHMLLPAEQSAYVYYQQVLALDEDNPGALQGIADIAAHQYGLAVEQQQKGNFLDAIELATSSAQLLPDEAKHALIQELERQAFERQQRLETTIARLLVAAERRVSDGQLLRPASDNAVVAYRKVLDLDPGNSTARAELEKIKMLALLEVEEKLDRGSLDSADALITRISIFFRTARPELEALSTRLMQLRNVPPPKGDRVLTQALLDER